MEENKILKIEKGTSGWGGPLYIKKKGIEIRYCQ